MNLHLAEIAKAVAPAAHAILLVDQAGWHLSTRLVVPANITIVALPPKCPELNPVENVWQFMRDNWLSNRVFKSYDDLVRPLLQRLEQARRSALAHHVHRTAPMGAPVLINGSWY
jgi:transposase